MIAPRLNTGQLAAAYDGRTLLVTGATGFLGKALIEKLLRQFPQVSRIFLLIRPRPGVDPGESIRLRMEQEIFRSAVFKELRAFHGDRFGAFLSDKVEGVAGDISEPRLGLSEKTLHRLTSEVDCVINVAALVGFDERLDHSVTCNTLGPKHLLEVAAMCRNPVVLHVSTAYVSGRRSGFIPEEALEPDRCALQVMGVPLEEPFRFEREIEAALRRAREVESESQTPAAQCEFLHAAQAQLSTRHHNNNGALHREAENQRQRWVRERLSEDGRARARRFGWFDTYTFSKALGEQMLIKHRDGVPLVIVRPSIIESSFSDPEPGWIEGFRMGEPILFGYGKGRVPDFPGHPDIVIDFVPVDFVVNAILAILAVAAEGGKVKVFQVATSGENPLLFGDCMNYCLEYFRRSPMRSSSGRPILPRPWKYRSEDQFHAWLDRRRHALSAALKVCDHVDGSPAATRLRRELTAQRLRLERLAHYSQLYGNYARLYCRFTTDNTRDLFRSLSSDEQSALFFDPTAIEWQKYIRDIHLPGVKRHVLKKEGREI
jgi:nucleoside-diphosphate-sugar epimerase